MTKQSLLLISLCLVTQSSTTQELGVFFGAGYAKILGPSRYSNPVSASGLGLAQSIPVNFGIRFTLPDEAINFSASGIYRALSGQGTTFYTGQTPSTIVNGETATKGSIWSGSLEATWSPSQSATGLYLKSGVLVSAFSTVTTWHEPSGRLDISEHIIHYGLSAGAGWAVPFIGNTILDLDAQYVADGLFSRENEEQGLSSLQFVASIVVPIWSK